MMNVVEESDCTEYGYKKLFNHVEVVDAWENFYDLVETSFKDQITLKFFENFNWLCTCTYRPFWDDYIQVCKFAIQDIGILMSKFISLA